MTVEKVADIRNELVKLGMSREEADALKPKSALVEARDKLLEEIEEVSSIDVDEDDEYVPVYDEVQEDSIESDDDEPDEYIPDYEDEDLELVSEESDNLSSISNKVKKAHSMVCGSKEWQDYIMSQFTDDELIANPNDKDDKLPSLAGLSRVGHEMFNVVNSGVKEIIPSELQGHPSCTVVYKVDIAISDISGGFDCRTYTAAGDAWRDSMNPGYDAYPAAIAESRAEARVWKKLLHLRNKPAYEEVSNKIEGTTSIFDQIEETGMINDTQRGMIEAKCKQFGIDLYKFINKKHFTDLENNPEPEYADIKDVPYNIAAGMSSYLTKLQTCTEDSLDIPEEIKL